MNAPYNLKIKTFRLFEIFGYMVKIQIRYYKKL